jgi:hypothetical protein
MSVRTQLRANAVALFSLVVALASFSYTTWRNERSEHNRTIRQASFQLLSALGEMQQVVYHAHYDHDAVRGSPRTGWVQVMTIADFSAAMPAPVEGCAAQLLVSWRDHWEGLGRVDADADEISAAIDRCRTAVLAELRALR